MRLIYLQRLLHIIFGHPFKGSKQVDKLMSENHYATDKDYIYSVTIRECKCGLTFLDSGLESRK